MRVYVLLVGLLLLIAGDPPQAIRSGNASLRTSRQNVQGAIGRAAVQIAQPVAAAKETPELTILNRYGQLPLSFEANRGQANAEVKFLARGRGYALFLTNSSAVMNLRRGTRIGTNRLASSVLGEETPVEVSAVLRLNLVGGNQSPQVSGVDQQRGKSNYLIGNDPSKWRTNIANYSKVRLTNVYPGINLVFYGNQQELEYDFEVTPGANPRAIVLELKTDPRFAPSAGSLHRHGEPQSEDRTMKIAANGDLVVSIDGSEVRFSKPVIYQREEQANLHSTVATEGSGDRDRHFIDGRWVLKGTTEVGFELGAYDVAKTLVIDPALSYSTYFGGSAYDSTFGLTVDSLGNAYVTGDTASADFPTTAGSFQPAYGKNHDAFVSKLNPAGTELVYSSYLGGSGYDRAVGIAVDSAGDSYLAGTTGSKDFPVTAGAFQTVCNCTAGPAAFVAKLNPSGSGLIYSTYLGGNAGNYGSAIALDSSGDAFVAGRTCSADFPVTAGAFQTRYAGGCPNTAGGDAYIAELNPAGSALIYSSYLGGSGEDAAYALAVDSQGNAYVSGNTNSTDFPTTTGAFQTKIGGGFDTFVAKVNPKGTALVYSTYVGGTGDDTTWGVRVDALGSAYLAGQTISSNFPTTAGAFQTVCGGGCLTTDGYVVKVNPSGSALDYSTYLGGSAAEEAFAIAIDGAGEAYVTGETGSKDFPTTPGSFQSSSKGGVTAFVTVLNAAGSALVYSTYFGSTATTGLAIATDTADNSFVVAGRTYSTSLPTTPGAFATSCSTCTQVNKASDGFIAKFVPGNQIWPLSLNFGNSPVGIASPVQHAVLSNSSSTILQVSQIQIGGTNSSDFITTSDTCGAPVPVGGSCSISVEFKASAIGAESAKLMVSDDSANSPHQIQLQGTGTYVQLTPSSVGFGKHTVGTQSLAKQISLTNVGSVTVNISGINVIGANSGDFKQTNTCGSTLAHGGHCSISVTFTPTTKGPRTAAISVSDDGGGSPQQVPLTGTGT